MNDSMVGAEPNSAGVNGQPPAPARARLFSTISGIGRDARRRVVGRHAPNRHPDPLTCMHPSCMRWPFIHSSHLMRVRSACHRNVHRVIEIVGACPGAASRWLLHAWVGTTTWPKVLGGYHLARLYSASLDLYLMMAWTEYHQPILSPRAPCSRPSQTDGCT